MIYKMSITHAYEDSDPNVTFGTPISYVPQIRTNSSGTGSIKTFCFRRDNNLYIPTGKILINRKDDKKGYKTIQEKNFEFVFDNANKEILKRYDNNISGSTEMYFSENIFHEVYWWTTNNNIILGVVDKVPTATPTYYAVSKPLGYSRQFNTLNALEIGGDRDNRFFECVKQGTDLKSTCFKGLAKLEVAHSNILTNEATPTYTLGGANILATNVDTILGNLFGAFKVDIKPKYKNILKLITPPIEKETINDLKLQMPIAKSCSPLSKSLETEYYNDIDLQNLKLFEIIGEEIISVIDHSKNKNLPNSIADFYTRRYVIPFTGNSKQDYALVKFNQHDFLVFLDTAKNLSTFKFNLKTKSEYTILDSNYILNEKEFKTLPFNDIFIKKYDFITFINNNAANISKDIKTDNSYFMELYSYVYQFLMSFDIKKEQELKEFLLAIANENLENKDIINAWNKLTGKGTSYLVKLKTKTFTFELNIVMSVFKLYLKTLLFLGKTRGHYNYEDLQNNVGDAQYADLSPVTVNHSMVFLYMAMFNKTNTICNLFSTAAHTYKTRPGIGICNLGYCLTLCQFINTLKFVATVVDDNGANMLVFDNPHATITAGSEWKKDAPNNSGSIILNTNNLVLKHLWSNFNILEVACIFKDTENIYDEACKTTIVPRLYIN